MNADSQAHGPWMKTQVAVTLGLAMLIALIPLWSVQIPPLLDYHNHLARQYILQGLPESKELQQFYYSTWHFIPYLAFDSIVQGLARLMPIEYAGKVFVSLLLLLTALAPVALNLALFKRVTPVALLGCLVAHNTTLTLGFVNYLFSIAFAVCLLALWIFLRDRSTRQRLVVFTILPLLLFMSHLLGFVVFTLGVAAFELGKLLASMRHRTPGAPLFNRTVISHLAIAAWQSLLSIALYLALGQRQPSGTFGRNTYGGLQRKFDLLKDSFEYLIPPYSWTLDRALTIAIPIALVVLLITKQFKFSRAMLWPIAALLLVFLAMPMEFIGGWGADHRLLVPLGLVLLGSIDVTARLGRWALVLSGVLAAVIVVRAAAITVEWRKADQQYSEYLRAFDSLGNGSKVFYAFGHAGDQAIWPRPTYHLPLLAVTKRHVYLPYLSVGSAVTLQYRPEVEPLQYLSKGPVLMHRKSPNWDAIVGHFDYFVLIDETHFERPVPDSLTRIFTGRHVNVYRGPTAAGRKSQP